MTLLLGSMDPAVAAAEMAAAAAAMAPSHGKA